MKKKKKGQEKNSTQYSRGGKLLNKRKEPKLRELKNEMQTEISFIKRDFFGLRMNCIYTKGPPFQLLK